MRRGAKLTALVLVFGVAACSPTYTPTAISPPAGAMELNQLVFLDGRAHQTTFTMRAGYPSAPALEHYARQVQDPWVRCEWSGPEWQRFFDATQRPAKTIHQQLHAWVNPQAERTLVLALRYVSDRENAGAPDSDIQRVALVEYFAQKIDETISTLKLQCPATS